MSELLKTEQIHAAENEIAAALVNELKAQGIAAELINGKPLANGVSWRSAVVKMPTNKDIEIKVDCTENARKWQSGYYSSDLRVWIENRGDSRYSKEIKQKVGFAFADAKELAHKLAAWAIKFDEAERKELDDEAARKSAADIRKQALSSFRDVLRQFGPYYECSDSVVFRTEQGGTLTVDHIHIQSGAGLGELKFNVPVERLPEAIKLLQESGLLTIKPMEVK